MTGPSRAGGPSPRGRRIPEATVTRLPLYQRILAEMLRTGTTTVSSEELATKARVNAAKVRKDFSLLGSFGTRGTGYDAAFLVHQIERALGGDRDWPVVIVGIGNLGRALANSSGFSSHGFRIAGLFDADPAVVGEQIGSVRVRHVDELAPPTDGCAPAIGVIATPAGAAQTVADALVGAGVASILNFAPRVLSVPSQVLVRYVDLSIELQVMSFHLARRRDPVEGAALARAHPGAVRARDGRGARPVGVAPLRVRAGRGAPDLRLPGCWS